MNVVVGRNDTEFYMPKNLLCAGSDLLRLRCEWDPKVVSLLNENPKAFVLFAAWLIRGSFESCSEYTSPALDSLDHNRDLSHLEKEKVSQLHCLVIVYNLESSSWMLSNFICRKAIS